MSNTSIDSQQATKSNNTNWQVTVGAGFRNLEVLNIGGAAVMTVKLRTGGAVTSTNGEADCFYLPAVEGASRVWTWDTGEPEFGTNKFLAISQTDTNQIAVSAW